MPSVPISEWRRGTVDRTATHFVRSYGPNRSDWNSYAPVALIGPPADGAVSVEFLIAESDSANAPAIDAVIREISFYFLDVGRPNPWAYCVYHCGTMANAYSHVHWEVHMSNLEQSVAAFGSRVREFAGFDTFTLTIGELLDHPDWSWGSDFGVYCFEVAGQIVYVGRALGCTLGERIADQLRHQEDPEWAAVVTGRQNHVVVFSLASDEAFMGAALEAFLIERLDPRPRFNSRIS